MRSLYEAITQSRFTRHEIDESIIDNDDRVISSVENALVVHHIADYFLDVFSPRISAFKIWNSYGIIFNDFLTNKAYDSSKPAKLSASWAEDSSKYNTTGTPLSIIYPKFNKLVDEFKKKLEKLKSVKRVEDTTTLDDPTTVRSVRKVYMDKSIRNLRIVFEDNPDLVKFDIEFLTSYIRGVGKRSLNNPNNIFVEVYAKFYFYNDDTRDQFAKIIEQRRKK